MTATTRGVHHVGLTVVDVAAARDFFVDALGFREIGGRPSYPAIFVSDGAVMLTLWRADAEARAFDRRQALGLHHLALQIGDGTTLEALHQRLSARSDVAVEFGPEPLGATGARHLMCAGPSGIRLELVEVPS